MCGGLLNKYCTFATWPNQGTLSGWQIYFNGISTQILILYLIKVKLYILWGKRWSFYLINYNFTYISKCFCGAEYQCCLQMSCKGLSERSQPRWQWATGRHSFIPSFDKTHQSEVGLDKLSHVHNFGTQKDLFYLILKLYTRYNLKECILLYSTQNKCKKK